MDIFTKIIKIEKPLILIWLIVPMVGILIATHYFFGVSKPLVLGVSTDNQIPVATEDSNLKLNQKFNSFNWNGKGAVSIIFTGSEKTQYDIAFPEVANRKLSASLTVPTNDIGSFSTMSWLNIERLHYMGWEIISQSRNQICDLGKLNNQNILDDEVQGSKLDLTNAGLVSNTYITPCGADSAGIEKTVRENYQALIKFGVATNYLPVFNKYNLVAREVNNNSNFSDIQGWIRTAKYSNSWLILTFPNISDDVNNNNVSHDLLGKTLDEVVKSGLQVVLPGEILKYDKK